MLFGKWSGTEVKLDGEELLIMKESDIMGVIAEFNRMRRPPAAAVSRRAAPDMHPSRRGLRRLLRMRSDKSKERNNGCQRREILRRRARAHAARRRHPRQRREGHARPQGPQRRDRQELRRAAHHQGRRDRRQGDRARRQVREHGRADGARGRLQDQRHRR